MWSPLCEVCRACERSPWGLVGLLGVRLCTLKEKTMTFKYVVIDREQHWAWIPHVSADEAWVAFMALVLGGDVLEM